MPSVTVAHVFAQHFHFTPLATGLAIGGSLSVGSFVGEFGGGIVVDAIMNRERRKRGGDVEPEVRLKAIWTGQILVPVSQFNSRKISNVNLTRSLASSCMDSESKTGRTSWCLWVSFN